MDFPEVVGALMGAGFEGYSVDYQRGIALYYLPSGEASSWPCRKMIPALPSILISRLSRLQSVKLKVEWLDTPTKDFAKR